VGKVYNLSGSDTAMFLNVMRRLRKHDEDRLVEAQLKREALDK